jgi:hypothetical protein
MIRQQGISKYTKGILLGERRRRNGRCMVNLDSRNNADSQLETETDHAKE